MSLLDSLWQDVRHTARIFARSPGFVAIAVLSISFGTGANVAIFSATDALILRPLPIDRADELLTVGTRTPAWIETLSVASYPDYEDIRDRSTSFAGLAAFVSRPVAFASGPDVVAKGQVATFVNADFFRTLGVSPFLGRAFRPAEDLVPGRDAVTILSHRVWQRDFAGDASVVGRKVRLAGADFIVVGVLPESFTGLEPRYVRDAVYAPLAMLPRAAGFVESTVADPLRARDLRVLTIKGRLHQGVTMRQAQAELDTIARDLERAYPATNAGATLTLQTELQVRAEAQRFDVNLVVILSMLSMAVLGVACANVAGLLTSRATARGHEVALRVAIGAGRARIVRQLLVESLGIGLLGGGLGIGVGYAGIILLQQIQMPSDVFAYPEFRLDLRALQFCLVAAIASAFLFGLVPALQAAKVDLVSGLKARDASPTRRRPLTGRHVLVAAQVALSLMLLTLAAWAYQMFRHHLGQGPGFRIVQSAKVRLSAGQGRDAAGLTRYFESAAKAARDLPSVTGVTVTSAMPLFGAFQQSGFVPDGYQLPRGEVAVMFLVNHVDEGYFATMEIPILRGRAFRSTDTADAPRVAIVNETLAARYWPGRDPVGQRLRLKDAEGPPIAVVGVARTTKYLYFAEPPQEMVYLPFRQDPRPDMVLVAATTSASASLLGPLGEVVGRLDPDVPLSELQTMESFFASRATSFGLLAIRMVGAMGIMGMTLTTVGLYALVSYAASRRTREIGIRMAVGATAARVLRMILCQGMKPAWGGLTVGLALSAAMTRLMPELIPLENRYDSRMYLLAVPIIVGVALLAAFVPARRSARIDPTAALRCE